MSNFVPSVVGDATAFHGEPVLRARGVEMRHEDGNGGVEALAGVDLDIHANEFVCLIGPSGSGKSTFLRLAAGLLHPTAGVIEVWTGDRGPETAEKRMEDDLRQSAETAGLGTGRERNGQRAAYRGDRTGARIGLVFQDANLMPWRTVRENIALPLILSGEDKGSALERADEWIELVGLHGFGGNWPRELSGGMAQRVAMARALIQTPDLLLLDEPFGALDALTRDRMAAELLRLWQARKTTVLMVTHSISEALLLGDRVVVFSARPGRVVLDLAVDIPRPREEEMRYTAEFGALARKLRTAIS